jgi:hypothetical protein
VITPPTRIGNRLEACSKVIASVAVSAWDGHRAAPTARGAADGPAGSATGIDPGAWSPTAPAGQAPSRVRALTFEEGFDTLIVRREPVPAATPAESRQIDLQVEVGYSLRSVRPVSAGKVHCGRLPAKLWVRAVQEALPWT